MIEQIRSNLELKRLSSKGLIFTIWERSCSDAWKRYKAADSSLLAPSLKNQVRRELKASAHEDASIVFAQNLEQLLLA